jgi:hypothetical protein
MRLYTATGGVPAKSSGSETGARPRSVSENASAPCSGKYIGASHQCAVSGTACELHQRIQVFKAGSPLSDANLLPNENRIGQQ